VKLLKGKHLELVKAGSESAGRRGWAAGPDQAIDCGPLSGYGRPRTLLWASQHQSGGAEKGGRKFYAGS